MARPGLRQHPKFKRLVHTLKEPSPHVLGYLECLWSVGYEHGKALIGDEADVELAAEWPGEPGRLCKALLACRLIDETDDGFAIHDLFDHAPNYVIDRARRETERQREKLCDNCESPYRSPDPHSKYCSAACRQASYRNRSVTPRDTGGRNSDDRVTARDARVTSRYGTPSPAQPSPKDNTPPNPPGGGKPKPPPKVDIPPPLDTAAFREAWARWLTYHRERKRKLTATTMDGQLKRLAAMGEETAILAIENSITNGWIGVFKPKGEHGSTANGHPGGSVGQTSRVSTGDDKRRAVEAKTIRVGQAPAAPAGGGAPPPAAGGADPGADRPRAPPDDPRAGGG